MRKLLSDDFSLSASLPSQFEGNFLSILCHTMNSADSLTDIIKLGPKLMKAALSYNLLEIDWKTLESEVHLPPFHKLRTLDSDDLSSLLIVYVSMYGKIITSVNCLSKTVRQFGSKLECRSLSSARITASWTDSHGSISPESGVRPGKVDCFIQHFISEPATCVCSCTLVHRG